VRLEAGGLYRSIRRLLADKLVAESANRPSADEDDERRRYYALTPLGRRVVAAEALRLRALVRDAEAIRLIDPEPA
jgi:DNA-binding PadR family transcriptional regulator